MLSLLRPLKNYTQTIAAARVLSPLLYSTTKVNDSSQNKLYELRTYSIKPAKLGSFLQLTNEKFHLRTAHSKLIGYWTSELGALNEVVHLWEYGMNYVVYCVANIFKRAIITFLFR